MSRNPQTSQRSQILPSLLSDQHAPRDRWPPSKLRPYPPQESAPATGCRRSRSRSGGVRSRRKSSRTWSPPSPASLRASSAPTRTATAASRALATPTASDRW
ncbi:hypothetical protein BRADI_2g22886v3 [Brachypodium distachyon]|uniref:Uncharacterized protein n=1 Tax=Brachypodium distachyon TaxID=15368 RepID=A0A2K2D9Y3_BRADI|nr:hypothetical protein BRADI_2g22886v3 [Brachypodium distachyon]